MTPERARIAEHIQAATPRRRPPLPRWYTAWLGLVWSLIGLAATLAGWATWQIYLR